MKAARPLWGGAIALMMLFMGSFPAHTLAQSPIVVTITTSDGKSLRGNLTEITEQGVHFDRAGNINVLPFEELSQIRTEQEKQPALPIRVALSGGSQISSTGIEWTGQSVTITPARQSAITVPVEQLRWVRFRAGNSATDPAWLGWLEETRRGDRLVVRRSEKSLDSIEGTALGIDRDSVEFEMRGNRINAPLSKLEGILLSNQTEQAEPPAIRLLDTSGSQWAVESIRMPADAQQVRAQLAGSIEHEIPVEQIREIRFAGGVLSLADAEIAVRSFGSESTKKNRSPLAAELDNWFSPETADGVVRIHAPGEIAFRIPEGYESFIVAARRHRAVARFTAVTLEVLLDDEVQWKGVLKDRESLGLELPLAGASQLTLRARPQSESPTAALGGTVDWFSGRLLK